MKLLLIAIHGFNVQWPGPYGNEWVNTPQLDALAAQSHVYDHYFCTHPGSPEFRESSRSALFSQLQARGIHTVYLNHAKQEPTSLWTLARQTAKTLDGIDDWLVWIETDQLLPPWAVKDTVFQKHAEISDFDTEEEPLVPWPDPSVGPVVLNDRDWERLRVTFACQLEELDRDITLVRKSFFPKSMADGVFVVSGISGFPLGDHGFLDVHPSTIFAEEVHVPLLIHSEETASNPYRPAGFSTEADLIDAIQASFAPESSQKLLISEGLNARSNIIAERVTETGKAFYVRMPDWSYSVPAGKAITDGLLFVKPDDQWEVMDLASSQPGAVEELTALLQQHQSTEKTS